jgi:CCR4-NOT complex subunit CAF16
MTEMTPEEVLAIDCTGLTYAFAEGLESALDGVDLQLKKGDRCLVVGANGGTSSQAVRPVGRSLVP